MKYEVFFQGYKGYFNGQFVRFTFKAEDLYLAMKTLCRKCKLAVMPSQLVREFSGAVDAYVDDELTPQQALEEIDATNGNGCDYLFLFKNLSTGEIHFRSEDFNDIAL